DIWQATARCYDCAPCVRVETIHTQRLRRICRAAKALRMNCFVINLDRSPNRLALVREQLTSLGLAWERVPAVDGSTLSLPDHGVVDEKAFKWRHHALLRRGEIGCYLSHRIAINRFLASPAAAGVILEDDVQLSADFAAALAALAACPDRW